MTLLVRYAITAHFSLDEFYDKETYTNTELSVLLSHLNIDFIKDLENLRRNINAPFTINNWYNKGKNQWRGARNPKCKEYSKGSQHTLIIGSLRQLQAVDFISTVKAETIRKHIIENYELYPTFKRLEAGVSWVHIDTKGTHKGILTFNK